MEPDKKIHIICQPSKNKFGTGEDIAHQQFMSAHKLAALTLGLMCTCSIGKNPIFPQHDILNKMVILKLLSNQGVITTKQTNSAESSSRAWRFDLNRVSIKTK